MGGFATDVRVRFAETDAQGIAHHAAYLVWFEVARVAYLEEHAGGYPELRRRGVEALVLESHVRYLQPARFDDRLIVHARLDGVRGARLRFEYSVRRGDDEIADGWTAHACVDASTLRPVHVPSWLTEAVATASSTSSSS